MVGGNTVIFFNLSPLKIWRRVTNRVFFDDLSYHSLSGGFCQAEKNKLNINLKEE